MHGRHLPLWILAAVLVLSAVAPVAAANEDRYAGYRASAQLIPQQVWDLAPAEGFDAPLCDWQDTGRNLGGACFTLDGEDHIVDISIGDFGQYKAYQVTRHVPRVAEPQPAAYPLVSGTYRMYDADGTLRYEDDFCGSATDLTIPSGVTRLEVAVDGGLRGMPTFSPCDGTYYAGATWGHIHLSFDW